MSWHLDVLRRTCFFPLYPLACLLAQLGLFALSPLFAASVTASARIAALSCGYIVRGAFAGAGCLCRMLFYRVCCSPFGFML